MELKAALTRIKEDSILSGLSVILISGYETPLTFLTAFYQRLTSLEIEVTFLDLESSSLNDCKSQLEMSFLGTRRLYILKGFSSLDTAAKKAWQDYIVRYQGPHLVLFFDSLGSAKRGKEAPSKSTFLGDLHTQLVIELPDTIDAALYKELFNFFYPSISLNPQFVIALFSLHKLLTLDDACKVMAYQTVVGRQVSPFFEQWVSKLIVSETSLFTLSESFFSRNPKKFFKLWKGCKETYPVEFWVAYWSEQLCQAVQYVQRARQFGVVEARKGFNRLPFTFINSDYKKYSQLSLSQAHDALYALDYSLKNGGSDSGLELWYHRFLATA
jgi:hypothetical protein